MGRFTIVAPVVFFTGVTAAACIKVETETPSDPTQSPKSDATVSKESGESTEKKDEFDPVAHVENSGEIGISPAQISAKIPYLRFRIDVGEAPVLGASDAAVTIVMFSDFECPFCEKGYAIVNQLREEFPDKIRLVYKAFPISQHPNALKAALMAEVAKQAGKFWRFHALLFSGSGIDLSKLFDYAKQVGLDIEQVERALEELDGAPSIMKDLRLARRLDINSTPVFFINGRMLRGAQSVSVFRNLISEELELHQSRVKLGAEQNNYYDEITRFAYREIVYEGTPEELDQDSIYPVDLGDSPQIGPPGAALTVVVFGDFECPYCARGAQVIARLQKRYGNTMRVVYKHLPLSFHQHARQAARASMVAHQAGKFWEFYGQLYERSGRLSEEDLRLTAMRLKLDPRLIESALVGEEFDEQIRRDLELAKALGVDGAPTFFINGRPMTGARPELDFRMLFAEELQRARGLLERGVDPLRLYEQLCGLK